MILMRDAIAKRGNACVCHNRALVFGLYQNDIIETIITVLVYHLVILSFFMQL